MDRKSLFSAPYRRLVRRLCGTEFAMQERNWREVLKVNAQYAEAHREALHHLDCVELEPSDDGTDWERVEAAKAALQGRSQDHAACAMTEDERTSIECAAAYVETAFRALDDGEREVTRAALRRIAQYLLMTTRWDSVNGGYGD